MSCVRHRLDLLQAAEDSMLKPEARLSTLAEVAVFMKAAYPALTLSIGKNGDHYAYRLDIIRIIRFSQSSSTATLNLKKSLTTRLDPDKDPHKHDQPWQGTGAELKAIVEEELRRYKMHFGRKAG